MADRQSVAIMTSEGAVDIATAERTRYAAVAQVRLYKSSLSPTPQTKEADFEANECDFTGYAPVTVAVWDPVGLQADGQATFSNATSLYWQMTDEIAPNLVGGAWLTGSTVAPKSQYYCIFDPPVSLAVALQAINGEWLVKFPGPGEFSFDF